MSEGAGEVEFEIVRFQQAPAGSDEDVLGTEPDPSPDPMSALDPPAGSNGHEDVAADVRAFDEGRFPLAGPIISSSTGRELKGRCSQCETRLRIRVKGPGAVKVRCPICGHTRRIEI